MQKVSKKYLEYLEDNQQKRENVPIYQSLNEKFSQLADEVRMINGKIDKGLNEK